MGGGGRRERFIIIINISSNIPIVSFFDGEQRSGWDELPVEIRDMISPGCTYYHKVASWRNGCQWDNSTGEKAAMMDHLEVLKWLQQNVYPLDTRTYAAAAREGKLEVLK